MSSSISGAILVVISALGFSVMPFFAISAYAYDINVPTLLFLRFGLAAAILFMLLALRKGFVWPTRRQMSSLFLLGSIFYALQSTCYFSAVQHISPGLAALILYTYPVFVALLSTLVERDVLTGKLAVSLCISVLGVGLVVGAASQLNPVGIGFALAAAIIYSGYIVVGNRLIHSLPSITATAFVCLFAALSFLAVGGVTGSLSLSIPAAAWPSVAGLTVFATVLAMIAFFAGLELVGSTRAAILSTTEPLMTALLSVVLLGQGLTTWQMIGGTAVLAGAVLVVLPQKGKSAAPQE